MFERNLKNKGAGVMIDGIAAGRKEPILLLVVVVIA